MLTVACERSAEVRKATIGQAAPDLAMKVIPKGEVRISDSVGRPVLVNFWASWCIPCRKEFPLLKDAIAKYPDLVVLGVVFDDSSKAAEKFMRKHEAPWRAIADADAVIAKAYGVGRPPGIPQTFFIDRHGVVVARVFGEMTQASLSAHLDKIIPKKT